MPDYEADQERIAREVAAQFKAMLRDVEESPELAVQKHALEREQRMRYVRMLDFLVAHGARSKADLSEEDLAAFTEEFGDDDPWAEHYRLLPLGPEPGDDPPLDAP